MKPFYCLITAVFLSLSAPAALAEEGGDSHAKAIETIRAAIEGPAKGKADESGIAAKMQAFFSGDDKTAPAGPKVTRIEPTPVDGLYEVVAGGQIFYFSADAEYLLDGSLIERKTNTNLTEQAESAMRAKTFAERDDYLAFRPSSEVKYVLNVFTDIDCGYCRRLHDQVPELNERGVEVRYFFYPRAGLGSKSARKAESAWCADDPQQRLTEAKAGQPIPAKTCDNPINDHVALANEVGLRGTPLMFTGEGTRINGYRPASQLMPILIGDPGRQ
ncbi:MAG: DsbC family protein [Pseudomonadota bacterium]